MKKAIVLGIMIVCIGLTWLFPHEMISPGELMAEHQDLDKKCMSCHSAFSGISNDKCISCHKLSDIGKDTTGKKDSFADRYKILFHQYLPDQECASCHTDHKGLHPDTLLTGFKHELLAATILNQCASCHTKPADTLHRSVSASCNGCHHTNGWKLSVTFDHAMIQGADKNNCTACHQKPKDPYHLLLNTQCDKCHNTSKWVPSTFIHSAYFQLDKDHNVTCITCHSNNNFRVYSCYGCHEHSEANMLSEHNEEGIYNISDCVSCHKSSNEHDIKMKDNSNEKSSRQEIDKLKDYIEPGKKDQRKEKEKDDD